MILESLAQYSTVEEAAKAMAGNYKEWRNFLFMRTDIPRHDTMMLGYLVNNEHTLRQLATLETVQRSLMKWLGDPAMGALAHIYKQDFCGDKDLLTGLMVQVYDGKKISAPFRKVYQLAKKLEASDNGVIDKKDFQTVNRRELISFVTGELPSICEQEQIDYDKVFIVPIVETIIETDTNYDTVDLNDVRMALVNMDASFYLNL